MNAIDIKAVTKEYPGFSLGEINLELPQGAIMGLVGENGAGKSTLIKLIMGAAAPKSGKISVLGVDNRDKEFSRIKEDVGVVLDEAYFPEPLNAKQLGSIMADTYERWDAQAYEKYLRDFGLTDNKPFSDFSRGMKMKLAIAVALSHSPKLLILDEATSGLDPMVRDEILDIFNDFTRDESHSVLLSSHIVSDLEKICDYIAFIHRGKLLLCKEKDSILEEYAIVKLSPEKFADLPEAAVVGAKKTPYGVEALVERRAVSPAFSLERTTLEEIILFLAKAEEKV